MAESTWSRHPGRGNLEARKWPATYILKHSQHLATLCLAGLQAVLQAPKAGSFPTPSKKSKNNKQPNKQKNTNNHVASPEILSESRLRFWACLSPGRAAHRAAALGGTGSQPPRGTWPRLRALGPSRRRWRLPAKASEDIATRQLHEWIGQKKSPSFELTTN